MTRKIPRRGFGILALTAIGAVAGAEYVNEDGLKPLYVDNNMDKRMSVYISVNDGSEEVLSDIVELPPSGTDGDMKSYESITPDIEYDVLVVNLAEDPAWDRTTSTISIPHHQSSAGIELYSEGPHFSLQIV